MQQDLIKILEAGNMAPSGENCQPWKFKVKDFSIDVFNLSERDQSLYSWGQRASYMANGAAIENIVIAASHFGYEANITTFPNNKDKNHVASITLIKKESSANDLYEFIFKRITNRKMYKTDSLLKDETDGLVKSVEDLPVKISFTQDRQSKNVLGEAGSVNESVMMSNKYLHQFFFSHVNWTKEEDDKNKIGFFIDTLELPPPARAGFKLFKYWPLANFFNIFGLNNMVARQNAEINSSAAGFGCITIKNNTPEAFVQAGRALQRIWLSATKNDVYMQPLTGVLFFMYKVLAQETEKFSAVQVKAIKDAYANIAQSFNVASEDTIAFMFRIGRAEKPTAQSSRFPLDKVIEKHNVL